ncbi:D-alanyl-D-alanine carboxypeptidase DacB [Clostridium pasteurianum DSM 525 = ATCC 6013]|uniref:serine-type D-Ala-D-Ala carboxypeptidase n=1 Tax=Clostridium pasteurianum DSM 525 = ATCC 6013 TaxID=1262449 RepID=A0A0H3J262_CLOPA|nr:D-alanyl-D-alanine carboxypeptidase family protein [Clostridium pasteurianum]AJA48006.1 D-alanyl-D-alanine carboxypeptidase DacB [Clostridium pasteurianum DSM 525 = ATCC 6013]AJA51994.1 D-alanyl-D-alanine carboxypeptidase DacB [Clostridium pasteurianum DSM 525 = ATCC 6013]AOZ75289.1 D-alanyl-D-alanine carboxypeptidase [Clostridium pasteurianum DSM 525 = ATCC 6013]AOZ79084.1 D-alanyl-D-alanine carboxypeptidase [Clostridium pasteurianum]ELP59909.1 D-alanyl-D-alanine carboxypeptidase [Clostrid
MKIVRTNKIIILLICFCLINMFTYNVKAQNLNVDAKAAIALDSKSKLVLYEKNSDMILPMASTTKIMTALVTIKYGDLDKKITISKASASVRGSTVGYKEGEVITERELLYGLMFRSGNDAAIALAEGVGGSVEQFLKLMNEYAVEIGAFNSHFESPHGLDSENHYCTAYDLALITAKAKENKIFNDIVGCKDVTDEEMNFTRSYHNINKILYQIPGANGVKTGYTGNAGKCLVTSVDMDGHDVIFVVLNCTPRWKETGKIYKYVKDNYSYKKLCSVNDNIPKAAINKKDNVKLSLKEDIVLPCENNKNYTTKYVIPKISLKKINKGDEFGKVQVYKEDKLLYSEPLIVNNNIKEKSSIIDKFFKGIKKN